MRLCTSGFDRLRQGASEVNRSDELKSIKEALQDAERARPWLPAGSLIALAEQESDMSPRKVVADRVGLMQVRDDDLKRVGVTRDAAMDWRTNIRAGLTVLDEMYSRFENPILAMTAYRAGSGKVADWQMGRQKLSRREQEYAPGIVARSTKHGGMATHAELMQVARDMGIEDLTGIYNRAGVARPEIPRGAMPQGDLLDDPNILEAMSQPISRLMELDEQTGRRSKGKDLTARAAFENMPGAPKMTDDQEIEQTQGGQVPDALALALGMPIMRTSFGEKLDRIIDGLWLET